MRIRAVWSGLERGTCKSGFGNRKVKIDMAPMTGKTPFILTSVVPAIPKEPGERAYLEEDLTRIGCIGLLSKPWTVKEEKMVRELIIGAQTSMRGLSERGQKPGKREGGERHMDSMREDRDSHPGRTSSLVGSFGMPQI